MSDSEWATTLDDESLPYPSRGILLGVCRNFADDVGMPAWLVRLVFIWVFFATGIFLMIGAYLVMYGVFYTRHPSARSRRQRVLKTRRYAREPQSRTKPKASRNADQPRTSSVANCRGKLNSVRESMHDCEARLRRIEKYVTSGRFRFDQEYRSLH